ncbi:hypothetical protein [Puia sp.]|jgi:hypothetical protein|uniref:hypothetical protein n=1 Tax=Puia sp. TaxID=2045100 RepID=UPI002F406F8D
MKKIPGFLLLILIALQPGCKKNNETISEVNAHIRFSDPAADGIGYFINMDSTHETVIPVNLPSGYKYKEVNAAVSVKLVDAAKRFYYGMSTLPNPGIRGVYIVTIRKI